MKTIQTSYSLSGYTFGDDFQVNRKPYRMHSSGCDNPCKALPLSQMGGQSSGEPVLIIHSGKAKSLTHNK